MIQRCNKGSSWNKWDLHIHTPKTAFSNRFQDCKNQDFIQKIKDEDIKAVGLTSYFRFEDGFLDLKTELNSSGIIVFPNLEFRLEQKNKDGDYIHIHIIFSDNFDKTLLKEVIDFTGRLKTISGDFVKDCNVKDSTISVDTLKSALQNEKELTNGVNYFIAASPKGQGGFRPSKDDDGRGNNIAITIDKMIDVVLGQNVTEEDIAFFQDGQRYEGAIKKPMIKCSDAHGIDEISNFTWIKGAPTFEGLKQAIYEPSRISIQKHKPDAPTNFIQTIKFDFQGVDESELCFSKKNTEIALSPYFNCFIGGRGSGKSTFLNLLGLKNSERNATIKKIFKDDFSLNNIDNLENKVEIVGSEDGYDFILQNTITDLAKKENKDKRTKFVSEFFQDEGIQKIEYDFNFNIEKLENIIRSIDGIKKDGLKIKDVKAQKKSKENEKIQLENNNKILKSEEFLAISVKIEKCNREVVKIQESKKLIDELLINFELLNFDHFINKDEDINENEYEKFYKLISNKITLIQEEVRNKKFDSEEVKLGNLKAELKKFQKEQVELLKKNDYQKSDNATGLESVNKSILDFITTIDNLNENIRKNQVIVENTDEIIEKLKNLKTKYEKIIEDKIEKGVINEPGDRIKKIGFIYGFDRDRAAEGCFKQFFDIYANPQNISNTEDFKNFVAKGEEFLFGDLAEIKAKISPKNKSNYINFLDNFFSEDLNFRIFKIIREIHLNNFITYKNLSIKYGEKDIEQASMGQKATAILIILLGNGERPIIIDEPEAHLDSGLIANDLIDIIKKIKNKRQIIFATHNANFVINGDAEKIFYLENKNSNQTKIIETTIEDLKYREKLCELEGGKEAFEKRGKKMQILFK